MNCAVPALILQARETAAITMGRHPFIWQVSKTDVACQPLGLSILYILRGYPQIQLAQVQVGHADNVHVGSIPPRLGFGRL